MRWQLFKSTGQAQMTFKTQHRQRAAAGVLMACAVVGGCTKEGVAKPESGRPAVVSDTTTPSVLATIGDDKVTLADVRTRAGERLDQLEATYRRQRDKIVGSALDTIVHERLMLTEVQKRGKTVDELIAAEAIGPIEPTDAEVAAWYNENQARTGGRTLDQVRTQIVDLLRNQRRQTAANKLTMRLRAERKVVLNFEPFRFSFNNTGAPTSGKKDAPVTLVEFSDFQCPFCKTAVPGIKQVEKAYADKVQIVYRQYPIPSLHPNAFKAAEASLCANEQGKFWALHDAMFEDQNKLSVSDLKATARRLGMDQKKFDGCLDSGRYVEQVQNDQKEAQRVGVNGTPTLFINGVMVDGGTQFPVLATLIEKELARVKQ
jgi:predicted DsbA family dithiol-disulfide isomerase